jgi:hypothetical protein
MTVWFQGYQVKAGKMPVACCPDAIPTIAYTDWQTETPQTRLFKKYFDR